MLIYLSFSPLGHMARFGQGANSEELTRKYDYIRK